jgi:hypothetical protein
MLFGRFTDETKVNSIILPAFNDYLNHYISLSTTIKPDYNENSMKFIQNQHEKYDIYSAAKDPAVG